MSNQPTSRVTIPAALLDDTPVRILPTPYRVKDRFLGKSSNELDFFYAGVMLVVAAPHLRRNCFFPSALDRIRDPKRFPILSDRPAGNVDTLLSQYCNDSIIR